MNREGPILHAVRAALAGTGRLTLWRNNTGVDLGHGVRYGIGVGGADLVGCLRPGGRFVAFETKAPKRGPSKEQREWAAAVRAHGGFYAIVRSPEAALEALARAEQGAVQ